MTRGKICSTLQFISASDVATREGCRALSHAAGHPERSGDRATQWENLSGVVGLSALVMSAKGSR
jgi:hypothetical protein